MSLLARCDSCGSEGGATGLHIWWSAPMVSVDFEPFDHSKLYRRTDKSGAVVPASERGPLRGPFDLCRDCTDRVLEIMTHAIKTKV